jgi:hypothetical protein
MCGFLRGVVGAFSPTDLFAVGLGLDFIGAYLLGRGLLTTPKEVARRMIQSENSFAAWYLRDLEDRVHGQFGVFSLAIGFALQLLGYALIVGDVTGGLRGAGGALVAVACSVGAGALVYVAWRLAKFRRLVALLSEFARYDRDRQHYDLPDARELAGYARVLGLDRLDDEYGDDAAYVHRVLGVKAVRVRDPATGEWIPRRAAH